MKKNKLASMRRAGDFKALFRNGTRIESRLFTLMVKKNPLPHSRFSFIISTKIDKRAVVRNRVRRMAREFFRKEARLLPYSFDIALRFKKEAAHSGKIFFYSELKNAASKILTGCRT